jgi:hypothetical protein
MNLIYNVAMKKNIKRILSILLVAPILLGCSNNIGKYGKEALWEELNVFFKYKLFCASLILDGWYEYESSYKNGDYGVNVKMYFEYDNGIRGNFIYSCFIKRTNTKIDVISSKTAWTKNISYRDGTYQKEHGDTITKWKPDGQLFNYKYSSSDAPKAYIEGNPIYLVDDGLLCTIKYNNDFSSLVKGTEKYKTDFYAETLTITREIKPCDPIDINVQIDDDSQYTSEELELEYA